MRPDTELRDEQCPVTALAHEHTGRFYSIGRYSEAGAALGLDEMDAVVIAAAADGGNTIEGLKEALRGAVTEATAGPPVEGAGGDNRRPE